MDKFSDSVKRILKNAEEEMFDLNHPYVGSEHLLLSLLKLNSISNISSKYNLDYKSFKEELINVVGKSRIKSSVVLYTPLLRKILDSAITISNNKDKEIDEFILMSSILSNDDGIALRILYNMNIDVDSLYNEIYLSDSDSLSIGVNLNKKISNILVGRDNEINKMIEVLLRKKKNNPILLGDAGVGKSSIVYELAKRIEENNVPEKLKGYQIISIDMSSLFANTKYRGEFEAKVNNLIDSVKSKGNIILFIDEIHMIVKSGGSEGSIDCANILKPYLASDEIKMIGATTLSEYNKYIAHDKALSRRFESILVSEPNTHDTKNILNGVRHEYEKYYNISISNENINDIVELADKYIVNRSNPDKSLDLLDNVLARIYLSNNDSLCNEYLRMNDYKKALDLRIKSSKLRIRKEDIISVIEDMTGIKILKKDDYNKLINSISKYVNEDISLLKKYLNNKFKSDKVFSLLIKNNTYNLHKIISESLNYNLIELDMSDYSTPQSISRIVGVDPGYVGYNDECLLDKIKYHPYSLIYLNNIDNADSSVLNIFKNIIDKGIIKNKRDEVINFNNTFIIMSTKTLKYNIGFNSSKCNDNYLTSNVIEFNNVYQN